MRSLVFLVLVACVAGQTWKVFGPDDAPADVNPNTYRCRDDKGQFIDSYNCDQNGRYVDMNGLNPSQRRDLLNQEVTGREKYTIKQYNDDLAATRGRRSTHESFRGDLDNQLKSSTLDQRIRPNLELGRQNAERAMQMEDSRLQSLGQVFPERAINDQDKLIASYNKKFGAVDSTSSYYADSNSGQRLADDRNQLNRKYQQAVVLDSMTSDQRASLRSQYNDLQSFVSRQRTLSQKYAGDAAAKAAIDANIAAVTNQMAPMRGITGIGVRTKTRSDAQTIRLQNMQALWKSRMYDPAWASPQKRAQAQRNIDRAQRALTKLGGLTYDSKGRRIGARLSGSNNAARFEEALRSSAASN